MDMGLGSLRHMEDAPVKRAPGTLQVSLPLSIVDWSSRTAWLVCCLPLETMAIGFGSTERYEAM